MMVHSTVRLNQIILQTVLVTASLLVHNTVAQPGYGYVSKRCETQQDSGSTCGLSPIQAEHAQDLLREILPISSSSSRSSQLGQHRGTGKQNLAQEIQHAVVVSAPLQDLQAWEVPLEDTAGLLNEPDADVVMCDKLPPTSSLIHHKGRAAAPFLIDCDTSSKSQSWSARVAGHTAHTNNGVSLSACGKSVSPDLLKSVGITGKQSSGNTCKAVSIDTGNGVVTLDLTDEASRRAMLEVVSILSSIEHLRKSSGSDSHLPGLTHAGLLGTENILDLEKKRSLQQVQRNAINMLMDAIKEKHSSALVYFTVGGSASQNFARSLHEHDGEFVKKYSSHDIQQFQIFLWTGVLLALVTVWIVVAMINMDNGRDPQLYSSFQRAESHPHSE
eukprot:gb/GECG01006283.1/.p1 GENE.gb/GECG01006283.1/~~gb/GECG01006283.1/.p1  ORF type:complete len:387 (+),score=42.91 gb/GECG01006283.1/:1-1161(+)